MTAVLIGVEVAYAPRPGSVDRVTVALPAGATLADAVAASGLLERHGLPAVADGQAAGIWGRKQPGDTPLRAHDRVELYRPLQCDPKEARRLRYRQRQAAAQGGPDESPPR